MQTTFLSDDQLELAGRVMNRGWTPRVVPTADTDLETAFVRAAQAWARSKERRKWVATR